MHAAHFAVPAGSTVAYHTHLDDGDWSSSSGTGACLLQCCAHRQSCVLLGFHVNLPCNTYLVSLLSLFSLHMHAHLVTLVVAPCLVRRVLAFDFSCTMQRPLTVWQ
jgi:hypothetical protein